jgi:hypothetical protein
MSGNFSRSPLATELRSVSAGCIYIQKHTQLGSSLKCGIQWHSRWYMMVVSRASRSSPVCETPKTVSYIHSDYFRVPAYRLGRRDLRSSVHAGHCGILAGSRELLRSDRKKSERTIYVITAHAKGKGSPCSSEFLRLRSFPSFCLQLPVFLALLHVVTLLQYYTSPFIFISFSRTQSTA